MEGERPFVCIPFGTRNRFARDLGLDSEDPIAALASFDGRSAESRSFCSAPLDLEVRPRALRVLLPPPQA